MVENNDNEDYKPKHEFNVYNREIEFIIKHKGEESEVLSLLHLASYKKYKLIETYFNVPIITLTAIIGFVSALNMEYQWIHIVIGGLSLYVSLLKSYFSYLKISQKSENHRVSYLQYNQISNEIRIELALSPELRQPVSYLMKLITVKMKNLNEVSEIIENQIIQQFSKLYNSDLRKQDIYRRIGKPSILNGLSEIHIYEPSYYEHQNNIELNDLETINEKNKLIEKIKSQQNDKANGLTNDSSSISSHEDNNEDNNSLKSEIENKETVI